MAAPKGSKPSNGWHVAPKTQRGANDRQPDTFDRQRTRRARLVARGYLESAGARIYRRRHARGRGDALKVFFGMGRRARPHARQPNHAPIWKVISGGLALHQGQRATAGLEHATQRGSVPQDFFRWLTRQNVILHKPGRELELPRMEKRLPQEVVVPGSNRKTAGRPT